MLLEFAINMQQSVMNAMLPFEARPEGSSKSHSLRYVTLKRTFSIHGPYELMLTFCGFST